tara:strand:+ start:1591 stop:1836 length:246 start_codon:yes stop_codon:yes gene_type:complete
MSSPISEEVKQGYRDYQKEVQRRFRDNNPEYYKLQYQKNADKRKQYARDRYVKKHPDNAKGSITDTILDNLAVNLSRAITA